MNKVVALLLCFSLLQLSACATTKRSSVAFNQDSGGGLSVWNPDMSAAVAYSSGQICMQRALAIKAVDSSTSVKLSDAILKLSIAAEKSANPQELLSLSNTIKQTVSLLTTTTERTAFLDMGMFYLCQISANGGLTDTQVAELLKILAITGSAMSTNAIGEAVAEAGKVDITKGDNLNYPIPDSLKQQLLSRQKTKP